MTSPTEPAQLFKKYQELQRYVGWSDDDVQHVQAAGRVIEPYLPQVIRDFYDEILRHKDTRVLITGCREQAKRLEETLRGWLLELFKGEYDQNYVSRRWRVGFRHVEIGLDRMHASGAFARLRGKLASALQENWQGEPAELAATTQSLNRLLDLDLAIIEYAYQSEFIKRQQTTKVLHEREERLRAIVNTCVDAIISIRHDGTIETFNPAAERMFGYSAEEAIGQNVRILMPSPYRDQHDQYISNYLKTGEAKIIGIGREAVGQRHGGSTFPIELAVSQIDHLKMFIGIIHDISERKATEERLLQSERLAAIGQMITGLAHESRNAFQRSQACLEMLELEVQGQPEAAELVGRIQKAHDHLHHLYEEVRDYAAPLNLNRKPFDLAQLCRDTWAHLEVLRKDNNVQLHEELTETGLTCCVDENAIEQLFRNILENAIAACGDPGEIVLHTESSSIDGREAVRFSITDNGHGFDPEAETRVFEPFFTTKTKGTGLGMAIARRIVDAHGGSIAVGNHFGSGGEVVVTLPRGER